MLIALGWLSNCINLCSLLFHGSHTTYQVFMWLSTSGLSNPLQREQIIYSCVSVMLSVIFCSDGCNTQSIMHEAKDLGLRLCDKPQSWHVEQLYKWSWQDTSLLLTPSMHMSTWAHTLPIGLAHQISNRKQKKVSWVWWHTTVISAFLRWEQETLIFQSSLGNMEPRLWQNKISKTKQNK